MSEPLGMPTSEFLFRVGMVLGKVTAIRDISSVPSLAPGQRDIQMWSTPDQQGYRYLLTFELRESSGESEEKP